MRLLFRREAIELKSIFLPFVTMHGQAFPPLFLISDPLAFENQHCD